MSPNSRVIHQEDALAWLARAGELGGCSLATSLPDFSEFPSLSLAEWRVWFERAAELVLRACPPEGVAIFYQRDAKIEGEWIDKSYLCQRAAERAEHRLLWHKIVARAPPGIATFGKPGYSHLLCFSRDLKLDLSHSTMDLLPRAGESSWPRGMGLKVCKMICDFISKRTSTRTLVAPFCGEGALLAMAEEFGLHGIGVERSRKRAERARELSLAGRREAPATKLQTAAQSAAGGSAVACAPELGIQPPPLA